MRYSLEEYFTRAALAPPLSIATAVSWAVILRTKEMGPRLQFAANIKRCEMKDLTRLVRGQVWDLELRTAGECKFATMGA